MSTEKTNWVSTISSFVISTILLVVMSVSFTNHEVAGEKRFHEIQELLLEQQIIVKDSLILETRAIVDSLTNRLFLYNPETIWLARLIYSETNRADEMEMVAWAARNRYELKYRGCETYKCVTLDPFQFSAFNWNSHSNNYYRSKSITDDGQTWATALTIAADVIKSDTINRPFSRFTVNFYSPESMVPKYSVPDWADSLQYVKVNVDPNRFRFYVSNPNSSFIHTVTESGEIK